MRVESRFLTSMGLNRSVIKIPPNPDPPSRVELTSDHGLVIQDGQTGVSSDAKDSQ